MSSTRRSIAPIWVIPPAFLSPRNSSRRPPPPPPSPQTSRRRINRIPVPAIIIPETDGDDPFSDFHSSSSSSSSSSSEDDDDDDDDEFDPTKSIRRPERLPPLPTPISTRMWELQNIPCPEGRSKLVAGKILNRGARSMRCSRKSRDGYVRSSLSNVVLSAPVAEDK